MIAVYVIPVFISIVLILGLIKRKNVYDIFVVGSKNALSTCLSLFPYICAILIMSELFEKSGLSNLLVEFLSPFLKFVGVPAPLTKLILIKPFSGSGSLALLNEILVKYGVNSYISLTACCLFGSSETIFYVSAVYFCKCKNKNAVKGIIISLTATVFSTIFCAFICRFFF